MIAERTPAVVGAAHEVPPKSRVSRLASSITGLTPKAPAARHLDPNDDTSTGIECHQCA
jgi:hypothetical protein